MNAASTLPRIVLALVIGATGGIVFRLLSLPLPWMLGAMIFVLVAAVSGAPILGPNRLRPGLVAVTGVLLGSGFRPDLLQNILTWSVSLVALLAYVAISAAIAIPIYRRFPGFDRMTAYFAAMPGGLTEMAIVSREFGADDRRVVLAHTARIVATIALVAFWFRVIEGQTVGTAAPGPSVVDLPLLDAAILIACGVIGVILGYRLRLPAPALLGPMLLSGAAHLAGLTDSAPPAELVIVVQVMLGTLIGGRFVGIGPRAVATALAQSAGVTVMAIGLAVAFAAGLSVLTGISAQQVLLGFAPGGLPEMSLVAIAIHADLAYVALHHLVRVVVVIAVAPLVARNVKQPK